MQGMGIICMRLDQANLPGHIQLAVYIAWSITREQRKCPIDVLRWNE